MTQELSNVAAEWATRSEAWLRESCKAGSARKIREREPKPIILNGDGVHLRVEKGTLHIRNGFTHYPQEHEIYRFFRGDLNLPSRIVAVDCSGGLSFDVLAWLAEQGVALICVDWKGDAVSVLACNGYAADREKVAWQVATRNDEAARIAFAIDLINRKLRQSLETLRRHVPESPKRDAAISKANESLARLRDCPPSGLAELRGIEGVSAASYFAAWRELPMKWKATARHPIPDDWQSYSSRSSRANGSKKQNSERVASAECAPKFCLWSPAKPVAHSGRGGRI